MHTVHLGLDGLKQLFCRRRAQVRCGEKVCAQSENIMDSVDTFLAESIDW